MGLFTRNKSNKKPIIKQILELIPNSILQSSIAKHKKVINSVVNIRLTINWSLKCSDS